MLEVLTTVAVVGVVTMAAFPSLQSTIRTFQRNGAAREVLAEIRATQSLAVNRAEVFGLQWGGDTGTNRSTSEFRIIRDTTGACGFPGTTAPLDDTDVIKGWSDLSDSYPDAWIQSVTDNSGNALGGVMFDARGVAVNTCTSASFPLRVTVADGSGETRIIEVRLAGGTRLL